MVEKKSTPRRASPKPGRAKARSKTEATLVARVSTHSDTRQISKSIIEHLTDIPARLVSSTLSELLRNTTHQATRIAILTARIEVLRARVVSCRMGNNTDGNVSLGTLRNQLPTSKPPAQIDARKLPTPGAKEPSQKMAVKENEETFRIKLLKTHVNEGIKLPKGEVFTVSATAGLSLIDREIAQLVPEVATGDENKDSTQATIETHADTSTTT